MQVENSAALDWHVATNLGGIVPLKFGTVESAAVVKAGMKWVADP